MLSDMCSPQAGPSTNVSSMTPVTVLTNMGIYHKLLSKHLQDTLTDGHRDVFPVIFEGEVQ